MRKHSILQFIACILFPFSMIAQTTVWKTKVDPVVLKKAETEAAIEFIAVLKQQADVSAADKLETKEEKGMFVYNSLKAAAAHSQGDLISLLTKSNATFQSFWVVNCVSIKADIATLQAVAELASVETIIENAKCVTPKLASTAASKEELSPMGVTWGISKTKANQVWTQLGIKGKGAVVAGEDTGYDWTHPALKNQYRGWNGSIADHNYNWHDAVHATGSSCGKDSPEPCDDNEHGTHTMGTMVGGNDGSGTDIGMAPEAKWMGCRNMNANNGTVTSYVECFQFFLAPTDLTNKNADPSKAPHVINNSWVCPTSEGCNTSTFPTIEKAVTNLRAAGVVIVGSAGNDYATVGCSSVREPVAVFAGTFTVGSTTSSDACSSFSNHGPVTNYGASRVSPDISAPGSGVYSSIPGGGYKNLDGTSMAGPHVAGLVALIISANPALAGKVATIEDIIQSTAVKLYSSACGSSSTAIPNNTFGYGRIDALAAVTKAIKMLSVNENGKTAAMVAAFPNPFSNSIRFEFRNWNSQAVLEIYSIAGTKVCSQTWEIVPSAYEANLSAYTSGAYFYRMSSGSEVVNGKLFKISE
jgi:serine protease AprX